MSASTARIRPIILRLRRFLILKTCSLTGNRIAKPVRSRVMSNQQFTEGQREDVFRDWATDKFGSITQLAQAYGMQHEETIYAWIKRYAWNERRADYLDVVFSDKNDRGQAIEDANEVHLQGWRMLQAHAMQVLKPKMDKNGKLMQCRPEVLQKMATVLERAQKGHRMAIGADLSRNEDRSKRVRVSIGDGSGESELRVLAKEVIDQHNRASLEDELDGRKKKKASAG